MRLDFLFVYVLDGVVWRRRAGFAFPDSAKLAELPPAARGNRVNSLHQHRPFDLKLVAEHCQSDRKRKHVAGRAHHERP
jgi:hypothetical protein